MENNFEKILELLREKADFQARLKLIAYDGTPEIKDFLKTKCHKNF
ncbi:MAG: hypothetical protein IKF64_01800 [Eubacterium sp.]|nr:hypothetical protein [Eubacterium sp.]